MIKCCKFLRICELPVMKLHSRIMSENYLQSKVIFEDPPLIVKSVFSFSYNISRLIWLCISSLCLLSLPEQSLKMLTFLKLEKRLKHQSKDKWRLFQCQTVYGKDMWHAIFSILATNRNANHSVSELLSVADRQMIKSQGI